MYEISSSEQSIIDVVRDFVDRDVQPVARALERENRYPADLIDQMKAMGVFGLAVPEPYGFGGVSTSCFALVTEELARGWMSLSGAVGGHSVVSRLIAMFGTEDQKKRYLPDLATGEIRATMALTEPDGGSDLQSIRTTAVRSGDAYMVNGSKMWITNGRRAGLVALLCKTDVTADPRHLGISILLVEKGMGYDVSKDLSKLGYRGIESCELVFEDIVVPTSGLLGGEEGFGFIQMMKGLELGRIQVAARAVGVARAAYEDALSYSKSRVAFGKPIWKHQAIGNYLADMATGIAASRLLVLDAAARLDSGLRCDLEAGMAKLFASETCLRVVVDAMRIHGGNGYSTEYDIERYYRDAPLMVLGEGTNEIQRNVITRQLVAESAP